MLGLAGCNTRFGASLDRPADPIVMTGAALPKLTGTSPQHIVGFSWDGNAWTQVPVQVDERDLVSPGVIYHLPVSSYPTLYGTSTTYKMLVYTPPPTVTAGYTSLDVYTPSDSDPTFDSNDELSFLAADTGKQADAPAGNPAGVDATTPRGGQGHRPAGALAPRLRLPLPQRHAHRWQRRHHGRQLLVQPHVRELQGHLQDGPRLAGPEQHLGPQPRDARRSPRPTTRRCSATAGSTAR